jgi:hypothetical protein
LSNFSQPGILDLSVSASLSFCQTTSLETGS